MKNTLPYHFLNQISYLFLVIAAVSCGGPKGNHFVIEGNIAGIRDSVEVVLFKTMDPLSSYGRMVAADTLIDGRYFFDIALEDSLDEYSVMLFSDDRNEFPSQVARIYAEPGKKAFVSGSGAFPLKWKVRSRVGKQKDWQTYLDYSAETASESGQLDMSLSRERKLEIIDSLNIVSAGKALEYLESEKPSEIWMMEFHTWAIMASTYKWEEMMDKLKALLSRLDETQMKNPFIVDALPYLGISVPLAVGDAFPEMTLYDAEGLPHKISEFFGKKILIEFSVFGCAPCKRAAPEIEELCKRHPEDIVAIIVNENGYEVWRNEAEVSAIPNKFEFNDDNDCSGVFRRLGTIGFPTFVLISADGKISDILTGYGEGSLLEAVLKQ